VHRRPLATVLGQMLRIAIDARAAAEERGGRGTYVRELLLAFAGLQADHRYLLYAREPWTGLHGDPRFTWRLLGDPDFRWHLRAAVSASRSADVFYSTNSYLTAWFTSIPTAVCVYDLVTYRPEMLPQRRAGLIERATLPFATRRAQAFIAISQATADDLTSRFPRSRLRTHVIPLAASDRFDSTGPDVGPVLERLGVRAPFVLSVGTLEPRKNLARLIEAFAGLPDDVRHGMQLVLVGAVGWDADSTLGALERNRAVVRALGHVDEADLHVLLRGAHLFAYPSLFEGFGLPVLEAMRSGTAVLTSRISSLPEVAGEHAIYVDPLDVGDIRRGLETGLRDPELRRGLADAGLERAATFSWRRTARETLDVLERLAITRGRRGPRAAAR
jgi:glycosyltransferase involved in cell wall biosynthesis